jgi:hypothetical protein
VADRKRREGRDVGRGVHEHVLDRGELPAQLVSDDRKLLAHRLGVGLSEDGADGRGHHFLGALGHAGKDVAHEVRATSLPGSAEEHRPDRALEPLVGVAR